MANHKSAEKRNRQRVIRTTRNDSIKTRMRHVLKRARVALDTGAEDAAAVVKMASRLLDRAASKNALPRKRAARIKSRLAIKLHRAGSSN